MARKSVKDRLLEKISPEPNSGCWLWTAGVNSSGYGMIGVGSRGAAGAHRISYELFKGPIPEGQMILHSCDCRVCINPDHLAVGTAKQNASDMISRGRDYALPEKFRYS